MSELILICSAVVCAVIIITMYARSKKPILNALKGSASGCIALLAVHFFGSRLGIALAVNFLNTAVSIVFGIPGVIIMSIAQKNS